MERPRLLFPILVLSFLALAVPPALAVPTAPSATFTVTLTKRPARPDPRRWPV